MKSFSQNALERALCVHFGRACWSEDAKSSKNLLNMQMIQTEYEKPSSSSSFQHFAGTLQVVA